MYCAIAILIFSSCIGLTPESVSLNGTYEITSNVFQENVASDHGAAVILPLLTAFTLRTETVTVFRNK